MSPEMIGLFGIIIIILIMFLEVPIWLSMVVVGVIGFGILVGWPQAMSMVAQSTLGTLQNYSFSVLPIFILMGEIANASGMMKEAYHSTATWLGRLPGGLAMASILGAAAFSCVTGSSLATAALMANVSLPELIHHKYDIRLSVGTLSAGGTLGSLIPPSGLMIIYAILAEVSIGKSLMACYIPGFLLALMYVIQILIQCKLNPKLAPTADSTTWKQKMIAIKGIITILIAFLLVIGGIQFGVFTPNEAASIATVFIFIIAVVRRTLSGQGMLQALKNTLVITGMALAVIIGANTMNIFVAASGVATALSNWLLSINISGFGLVILIMVVYFILAIPMDPLSILLLTLPIFLPVLKAFDVNLLWFGVLVIVQSNLGNLTPPVGMSLFVVASIAKPFGVTMGDVFRGSIPFCVTCVVFLILLVAFPQISLFLVNLMKT
jgi:C4-dicarboxylate transporter DctM subunit